MAYFCRICMDDIRNTREAYMSSCGHLFHKNCIIFWYRDFRTSCSVCHGTLEDRELRSPILSSGYSSRSSSACELPSPGQKKSTQILRIQPSDIFKVHSSQMQTSEMFKHQYSRIPKPQVQKYHYPDVFGSQTSGMMKPQRHQLMHPQIQRPQSSQTFQQANLTPIQLWNDAVSLLFKNPKTYKDYGLE